jgi:maltose O-acetyltransferase
LLEQLGKAVEGAQLAGVVGRHLRRAGIWALNRIADFFPDGALGYPVRRSLWRVAGARLGPNVRLETGVAILGTELSIGANSYINRRCYFDLTAPITLGERVTIGHGVSFITAQHAIGLRTKRCGAVTPLPITVGDGAWVGANATIMPGVSIGAGAVVAAGAVVTKSVDADTLVGGVPAVLLRPL